MNWIIFVCIHLVCIVLFDQFYKISTKTITKPGALTVLLQIIGAITALIISSLFEMKFPTDRKVYFFLGLALVFYSISDRLNTTVRSGIEASTFSIIRQLSTVFMIFAGLIFLKEPFILNKFIGAILIILSNILIFYKKGEGKPNKYIILGIVSNICYTIALFLDVNISNNFNLPFYVAISLGVPAILIFILEKVKISDIKNELKNGNKKAIIITGITWALSIIAQLRAYQLGDVSIVAPLCSLAVILNVIVGYLFQKERENMPKKIVAAILIVLGIVLIKV